MSDDNQTIGALSDGVEYHLIETDKGNSVIVAQLPNVEVSFHTFSEEGGHEKEVARQKLDLSPEELEQFREIPHAHTLKFDRINNSVIVIPKKIMPNKDKPMPNKEVQP